MLSQRSIGAAGKPPLPSDDEFNRVSFLSHFDGTNNGVNNVFDDSSSSNHTLTASGNVTQGSFGPFARPDGEWGVDFKNTSALVLPASSTDFDFGTADFTIECYMQYLGGSSDDSYIISFGGGSGNAGHFGINIYQGNWRVGAFNNDLAAGTAPTDGDWHHIAVVYVSNVFKLYVDGSIVSSSGSSGPFNTTTGAVIGGYWANSVSNNWNGLLSNLRIVKGTAVYTSNFTPPTGPLTAISGTVLLTCQSNRFVDNSASAHTITPAGNPAVSAFGPILTSEVYNAGVNGASAYFDRDDSTKIIISDNLSDFQFGTGAFTVEGWVYKTDSLGSGIFTSHQVAVSTGYYLSFGSSKKFGWGSYDNGDDADSVSTTAQALNEWIHFAVVRTGTGANGLKIYVNGQLDGTFTDTSNYTTTPYGPFIGGFDTTGSRTGDNIQGYISDMRVVKGTAVYTGNFTPPTAPLTAVTNTILLSNMADGQAIDSAAQNNLTLVGDAKISTAQSKFGGSSMLFDGTGDYAYTTVSTPIAAGDYTVECFVYFNTVEYAGLWQFDDVVLGSQAYHGPVIFVGTSSPFKWATMTQHGSNQSIYSTSGPSADQWYHVANVRTNGVVKIFVDGTQIIDDFDDTTDYSARNKLTLGAFYDSDYYFDGYIDEFRVSQFARYTSDFTPPTEPFADKGE